MEDVIKIYELLSSNWTGIMVGIVALVGAIGKLATVVNAMFPKVITNKHIAKIKKVLELISFGTQKAEIKK